MQADRATLLASNRDSICSAQTSSVACFNQIPAVDFWCSNPDRSSAIAFRGSGRFALRPDCRARV